MRNKNVLPIIFTAKQIFLCLQHVENKGFQTVIKHRLKAIQKPIKNELGNREKNTENAHFVLKKCTFRFRDYSCFSGEESMRLCKAGCQTFHAMCGNRVATNRPQEPIH